jgi:hypothetical protein
LLKEVVSIAHALLEEPSRDEVLAHATLLLFGHTNAALYLLEHAVWARQNREPDADVHRDAFSRWVVEGGVRAVGVQGLLDEFYRGRERGSVRVKGDKVMIFGASQPHRDGAKL